MSDSNAGQDGGRGGRVSDIFSRLLDFASSAYPPMDYAVEDAVNKAQYYASVTLWCPREEALIYRCAYVRICRERGVDVGA